MAPHGGKDLIADVLVNGEAFAQGGSLVSRAA
jgi:hypothetical protein